MSDKEYVCLSCDLPSSEDEIYTCSCGKKVCPACGGEVQTVEEYNENMRLNNES